MKIKEPKDDAIKTNIPPIDLTICRSAAFGLKIASKPMNPYQVGERYFNNSNLKPVLHTIKIIRAANDITRAVDELSASDEIIKQSPIKHPKYNVNKNQDAMGYRGVYVCVLIAT
jgi:hypothetical protein